VQAEEHQKSDSAYAQKGNQPTQQVVLVCRQPEKQKQWPGMAAPK
jgi:hypothetical protein